MTTLSGIVLGAPGGPIATGAVAVPPVVGSLRADAEKELKRFGFKAVVEEVEAGGTEDEVYAQDPTPPITRPRGAVVRLFVVKNPVSAPDLSTRFDALDTAVAAVDAAVKGVTTTLTSVANKVDKLSSATTGSGTSSGTPKSGTTPGSGTSPGTPKS